MFLTLVSEQAAFGFRNVFVSDIQNGRLETDKNDCKLETVKARLRNQLHSRCQLVKIRVRIKINVRKLCRIAQYSPETKKVQLN